MKRKRNHNTSYSYTVVTGATTAQINLAPSTDLPRKERDGAPKTQKTSHSTTHTPTTHGAACTMSSDENKPSTPGQDDDPDRIDDVV